MMEIVSLKTMDKDEKTELLRQLNHDTDGEFVTKDGKRIRDRYTDAHVPFNNMAIVPGEKQENGNHEIIILECTELSISHYLVDFEGDLDPAVSSESETH